MPDGDRFEWRLRGKKWRTVYRLMTSRAEPRLVADHAVKGAVAYIRDHPDVPYRSIVHAVFDTIRHPDLPMLPPESTLSGATSLMAQLDSITRSSHYSEPAQLAKRAAWKAFMRLDGVESTSEDEVAAEFMGEMSWEIIERRCVGVARDQVMHKARRTVEDQEGAEAKLHEFVRDLGKSLGQQLSNGQELSSLRAPRRTLPKKEFTIEDLHKPISVDVNLQ